jgi:hypothetical protein
MFVEFCDGIYGFKTNLNEMNRIRGRVIRIIVTNDQSMGRPARPGRSGYWNSLSEACLLKMEFQDANGKWQITLPQIHCENGNATDGQRQSIG